MLVENYANIGTSLKDEVWSDPFFILTLKSNSELINTPIEFEENVSKTLLLTNFSSFLFKELLSLIPITS